MRGAEKCKPCGALVGAVGAVSVAVGAVLGAPAVVLVLPAVADLVGVALCGAEVVPLSARPLRVRGLISSGSAVSSRKK